MTTTTIPAAGEVLPGPTFGLRVMALSPERRAVVEAALDEARRADLRDRIAALSAEDRSRLRRLLDYLDAGIASPDETEVERRFSEWRKARAAWQAETLDARGITFDDLTAEDEDRFNDLVAGACDAQDAVIAAPSVTARDVLLKVVSLTESTLEPNDPMHAVIAEAARFAGA